MLNMVSKHTNHYTFPILLLAMVLGTIGAWGQPEAIQSPTIAISNNQLSITSPQTATHNGLTLYYEMGNSEPATPDPTTASPVYDSENPPTINDDIACIKALAVHISGQSEVSVFNIVSFSSETITVRYQGTNKTVTVAPIVYSRDLAKPSGMTPYIVKRVTPIDRSVILSPLEYIPEDVPVLLLDEAATPHTGTQTTITLDPIDLDALNSDEDDTNDITPITASDKAANKLNIVSGEPLTVKAAQVYMYHNGKFVLTMNGDMPIGRFYLYNPNYQPQAPAPSSAPLLLVIEEPTGINVTHNDNVEKRDGNAIYDLQGRRIATDDSSRSIPKKGIYISNDKKIIVK